MAYIYDLSDAWAASGTVFTALKANVTDTASAAGSLLMDLQVGGVSKFSVAKTGDATIYQQLNFSTGGAVGILNAAGSGKQLRFLTEGTIVAIIRNDTQNGITVRASDGIGWGAGTNPAQDLRDTFLTRDAANTLGQRNGVNAQTVNLYGSYTDASNYRRLTKTMSTGGVAVIKPEGAGTGVSGNVLHISGLPTSNPGPGILWNNAGTPAIGT